MTRCTVIFFTDSFSLSQIQSEVLPKRVAACRASNATARARDLPQHRPDRAARPSLRRCWCLLVVVTPRHQCSESTFARCVLSAVCSYCTLHGRVRGCVRSSGSMSAAHLSRSRALQSRYLIMLFTHRNPVVPARATDREAQFRRAAQRLVVFHLEWRRRHAQRLDGGDLLAAAR